MLTLYATANRLDFDPFPGADHVIIQKPPGSDVLRVRNEPLLFVPSGRMTRHAWTAEDVYRAAKDGVDGFDLIERVPAKYVRAMSLSAAG